MLKENEIRWKFRSTERYVKGNRINKYMSKYKRDFSQFKCLSKIIGYIKQ